MTVNWITARLVEPSDEAPMYAVLPDDETNGLLVGEIDDVISLRDALNRLLVTQAADESIDAHDERLGWHWIEVAAIVRDYGVPASTARRWMSEISSAKQVAGRWRAPRVVVRGYIARWRERSA